jgi:hypothetical protein
LERADRKENRKEKEREEKRTGHNSNYSFADIDCKMGKL